MKYIDTKKLIAKIQGLRSESCISESDEYYEYAKSEIIGIIESLQQEQPSLPSNLDEAAFKYENAEFESGHNECGYAPQDIFDAFKAGAKWMAEQGEIYDGKIQVSMRTGDLVAIATVPDEKYKFDDKVIVQIRKNAQ